MNTTEITLRKLTPAEGMVITDKETETLRSAELWLGKEDSEENYLEIPADTPFPEEVDE